MKLVDFHMHTTHSDGSFTPAELMRGCKAKNLSCISVTDHDTMSSFEECKREADAVGLELVPGVEISAEFQPGTLHILGYFLNREHPELSAAFEDIQKARRERNPLIIKKLNQLGIDIALEDVLREAYGTPQAPPGSQLGRPHFAKALIRKRVVKKVDEAFQKYLAKGKPAYVNKRRLSIGDALRLINEAGGIASVAHPKQMRLEEEALEQKIKELKDRGLGAVEVYNSCHRPEDSKIYLRIAKKYDLVVTGGSDFHGANKPGVEIGYLGNGVKLGYEMVEHLKERIQKRRERC